MKTGRVQGSLLGAVSEAFAGLDPTNFEEHDVRKNEATLILESLGVAIGSFPKEANGGKNPSWTKKGPGRYHQKKSARQVAAEKKARS
jgi:hypothetical protein